MTVEVLERRRLFSIVFNNIYDPSITSDFPNHAQQLENAFQYAEQQWTNLLPGTNAVVTLDVKGNDLTEGASTSMGYFTTVPSTGYAALLSSLPDLPASYPSLSASSITAASETGTTVTVTATNAFKAGETVTLAGFTPSGYNGSDTIATASATSFTFSHASGLAAATVFGTATVQGLIEVPGDEARVLGVSGAADGPVETITAASEAGTTVSITASNTLLVGQQVSITGISPYAYDGVYTIATANSTGFTYTDASGLGTATLSSPVASGAGEPITAASESGTTLSITANNNYVAGQQVDIVGVTPAAYNGVVTIASATSSAFTATAYHAPITAASETGTVVTVTASNNFATGQSVVISGVTPSGYNGTYTLTGATSTSFTYTHASGLAAGTAFGVATPNNLSAGTAFGVSLPVDATIDVGTNLEWDFNAADRTVNAVNTPLFDFVAVAEHEIAHALGRYPLLGTVNSGDALFTPFDLYRYNGSGVLEPQGLQTDYFSIDQGMPGSGIEEFAPNTSDPSDWNQSEVPYVTQNGSVAITAASESVNTVTITANNSFFNDEVISINGVTSSGYDGLYQISSVTSTSFKYTDSNSGLGAGTAFGTATPAEASITAASQSGLAVTVTANNTFYPGEEVNVSGLTPAAYNGTVTVTAASATSFVYTQTPLVLSSTATASESGTTVKITTSNSFSVGNQVIVAGISPPAFDGDFTITSATSTYFEYAAYAGSVSSATESGSTVTIHSPVTSGISQQASLQVGESVVVSGVTPSGYNGTYTVTAVDPYASTFTYSDTAHTGLGSGSGGSAAPSGIGTFSDPTNVAWLITQVEPNATVTIASLALLEMPDSFNASTGAYENELSPIDVQDVMQTALGYKGTYTNTGTSIGDSAVILQESFTWNGDPVVTLYPGASYVATLLIANTGTTNWVGGNGTTWAVVNPAGQSGGVTVYLPTGTTIYSAYTPSQGVGQGPDVWQISFAFTAPSSGTEEFQMIHEGSEWFGEAAQVQVEGDGTGSASIQEAQLTQFNVIDNGITLPMTGFAGEQVLAEGYTYLFNVQYLNLGENDWVGASPEVWTISQYTNFGATNYNGTSYSGLPTGITVKTLYDNAGSYTFTTGFDFTTGSSSGSAQIGFVDQNVGFFGQVMAFEVG